MNANSNEAIAYFQAALKNVRGKNEILEAGTLVNLGSAYLLRGEYNRAIEYLEQSLVVAQTEANQALINATVLGIIGIVYFEAGDFDAAEASLQKSIKAWESLHVSLLDNNKTSLFEVQLGDVYNLLEQIQIKRNRPDIALKIADEGRSKALVELLSKKLEPSPASSDSSITLAQIKEIARSQNATLVSYTIARNLVVSQGIERQASALYIWVVKPNGELAFREVELDPEKPLWELVRWTRRSLGTRSLISVEPKESSSADLQQPLQTLHQLLIEPIADLLPSNPNDRVVFIPQGPLFLVPFPALLNSQKEHLIERHTISISPSIKTLQLTRQQKENLNPARNMLVLGDPSMPNESPTIGDSGKRLKQLPGARKEARAIASLLNTQAIFGSNGTEETITAKMSEARIIHLATHGYFNDQYGLDSAIALAPSENNNGWLTAGEIFDLKLNAELVVLSACNTGRGRLRRGEGVIGLSRSFISAGVPSVIVSLWSVPDAPTAELMSQFYRNLEQSGMDKAQALRQAMLATMETNPNPKNWAAFTLIGEAE